MSRASANERTDVVNGVENATKTIVDFLNSAEVEVDICADRAWPSVAMDIEIFRNAVIGLNARGLRCRFVTEITKENISFCKQLMKIAKLRHLDGARGNFAVSEKEYIASAIMRDSQLLSQVIYSNSEQIIAQQKYLFETLWNKATLAEQKINEIDNDIEPEFFEVINDPSRAKQVFIQLANSVRKEGLLLLPNSKALEIAKETGILQALTKASVKRKASIRIIVPFDEKNRGIIQSLFKTSSDIQIIDGKNSESIVFIIDSKQLFSAELREEYAGNFSDSTGLSVHSNSKATVNSFKSFFDLLWNSELLNEKLRISDEMQKEFIRIAAHELKTPIQPILIMAEILEKELGNDREEINLIIRNAKRLHYLTQTILDLSKIETKTLTLEKRPFNIGKALLEIVQDYNEQQHSSHRNTRLRYQPEDIFVKADKERIIQVISNLINNALRFSDNDGIISISTKKAGKEIIVVVKDCGEGIDPEIYTRLFTRFATKSAKGTGLGLYISKSIVEAHGGRIWATNNPSGKGATFAFSLPKAR